MVSLFDPQIEHVNKIIDIFKNYKYAIDLSSLGSGKTYTGCYLGKILNLTNILVICPKCVEEKWKEVSKMFDLNIEVISYNSFRSITNSQPKHGYLRRTDTIVTINKQYGGNETQKKTEFFITEKLREKVNKGMFVICDEFQNLKNMGDQTKACITLFKEISQSSDSRILLISGSPFDKKEQVVTFYRLIGVMKNHQVIMHNPKTLIMEWKGMSEIYNFCNKIDQKKSARIMPDTLKSIKYCHEAIYKSFQEIVKPVVGSCMVSKKNDFTVNVQEAHYHMDDQLKIQSLKNAIDNLKTLISVNPLTGRLTQVAWQSIGNYLKNIELIKLSIFSRIIAHELIYGYKKIVVCFNYTDSILEIADKFKNYNPLILNGSVSTRKRQEMINNFQKNDNSYRLLIGNLQVCSIGIDLDDKFGSQKRLALVSPTYNIQNIYQFGHRFDRRNTLSRADVNLVFCKEASEIKILNALARKGSIMKETTPQHSENGTKFPGEYPQMIESNDWKKKYREKYIAFVTWFCKQDEIGLSEVSNIICKYY